MSPFLNLPGELHLQIFYALPTTTDAVRLARTCSQLHDLYNNRKTKINILRHAANVPSKFYCDSECALSDCTRIAPWKWWLWDKEGYLITLTIDYSSFSEECVMNFGLRDMGSVYNGVRASEHKHPIFEFLDQFDHDERRRFAYEACTREVLKEAAQLQKRILSDMLVIPDDLTTSVTVIALLLNCLAISQRIDDFGFFYSLTSPRTEPSTYYTIIEEADTEDDGDLRPLMALERQRPMLKPPKSLTDTAWNLGSTLESTLQLSAELLLQMTRRQDPRDFPKVLYSLCIIHLIQNDIEYGAKCISCEISSVLTSPLLPNLSRLYYICSHGGQPLQKNFDREAYAKMVENDQVAIWHCDFLRELWVDGTSPENYAGLNSFQYELHYLVEGRI